MSTGIALVVGLGNPGQQYQYTRHNAGAMFLARLASAYTAELKPEARFKGLSGRITVGGNEVRLEVAPESTIADIIAPFNLPMKLVHLVLINGVYVSPEDRATRTLKPDDVLAIWPPIAGG